MKKYQKLNHSMIERIDTLRKAKKMTWADLAGASDLSTSCLSTLKLGKVETKFSTLWIKLTPKRTF